MKTSREGINNEIKFSNKIFYIPSSVQQRPLNNNNENTLTKVRTITMAGPK